MTKEAGYRRHGQTLIDDMGLEINGAGDLPEATIYDAKELQAIARATPAVIVSAVDDGGEPIEYAWRGGNFVLGGRGGLYRSNGAVETLSSHLEQSDIIVQWGRFEDSDKFSREHHPELIDNEL